MDGALRCLLGNHDLHLLRRARRRKPSRRDTLASVLEAATATPCYLVRQRRGPRARARG